MYRTEQGNTFAWITLSTHAFTNFFKILQDASNFCKTQHVLYFLNAWGSRISNMTFPCVMKVMTAKRISVFLCISLHFSTFLFIYLHFSCNSLHFSEFITHFSAFICVSLHFSEQQSHFSLLSLLFTPIHHHSVLSILFTIIHY